jgi:hypothetical protein
MNSGADSRTTFVQEYVEFDPNDLAWINRGDESDDDDMIKFKEVSHPTKKHVGRADQDDPFVVSFDWSSRLRHRDGR